MNSHCPRLLVGLAVVQVFVGALVFGPSASAAQPECQVVNPLPKKTLYTSDEYASPLQAAIDEAEAGDTLQVLGTCYGDPHDGHVTIDEDLTITGQDARTGTIRDSVLVDGATVEIAQVTITGGSGIDYDGSGYYLGGGISNRGTLTLIDSTVSGNTADLGGGISSHGVLMLTGSTVSDNTAGYLGGGISNWGATLTLTDSTVSDNSAGYLGGGILNFGPLMLTGSTVSGNTAGYGGGIFSHDVLTLAASTVSDNTATLDGGGIYTFAGTLTLTDSAVSRNTAGVFGGGIFNLERGTLTLTDSSVSRNTADWSLGGGIFSIGSLSVVNTTICGNSPPQCFGPGCPT